MEALSISLLHLFLSLLLQLGQLDSLIVASYSVVLICEDFSLVWGQLSSFGFVLQFVLELCDLSLLQFRNEIIAFHGEI